MLKKSNLKKIVLTLYPSEQVILKNINKSKQKKIAKLKSEINHLKYTINFIQNLVGLKTIFKGSLNRKSVLTLKKDYKMLFNLLKK